MGLLDTAFPDDKTFVSSGEVRNLNNGGMSGMNRVKLDWT